MICSIFSNYFLTMLWNAKPLGKWLGTDCCNVHFCLKINKVFWSEKKTLKKIKSYHLNLWLYFIHNEITFKLFKVQAEFWMSSNKVKVFWRYWGCCILLYTVMMINGCGVWTVKKRRWCTIWTGTVKKLRWCIDK